jgi:hypothetical protein
MPVGVISLKELIDTRKMECTIEKYRMFWWCREIVLYERAIPELDDPVDENWVDRICDKISRSTHVEEYIHDASHDISSESILDGEREMRELCSDIHWSDG